MKTSFVKSLRKMSLAAGLAMTAALPISVSKASAQSDPLLGQMMLFGGNFCPRSWARADGQLLPISQNSALFSILGTMYGGDGRTTFALPDLRGRIPLHNGTGAGLPTYQIGQRGGAYQHTLSIAEMPSHNHMVNANNSAAGFADRRGPGNDFLGTPNYNDPTHPGDDIFIYADQAPNVQMDPRMIENTGGNQAFSIQNPYLGMTWCIATQGIYPSRN